MQAARAQTAEPTLDSFIDWSQRLRWEGLPGATRAMVKQELLDGNRCASAPYTENNVTLEVELE